MILSMHNAVSLIKHQVLLLESNKSQHNDMPRAFMIQGSDPSRYMRRSLFSKVRISSGTHPASYTLDIGGFFPQKGGTDFQSNVCFVEIQTYILLHTHLQ
jgi:hypothetical protein